jgi:hypothetical protein
LKLPMTAVRWLALAPLLAIGPPPDVLPLVAGEHYRGDGRGLSVTLSLRADATYSFTWGGHLGSYADTKGTFRLDGSSLALEPSVALAPAEALMLPSNFVVVRWAHRVYLIPEAEGANFAAHVSRGEEPRTDRNGWFLLRRPDWEKPPQGSPQLPTEWQKWLLRAPVEARITRGLARHRAEIDVGSKGSVNPGLVLTLVSKKYGWTDVRVVSVTAHSSIIENDYGDPPLLAGGRVTSRPR